jgi:hypothetical protein
MPFPDDLTDQHSRHYRIGKNVGFPKPNHVPARVRQLPAYFSVALAIPGDFGDPVACIVPSKQLSSQPSPVAAMPKIPVTEDCNFFSAENNIRVSRQIGAVLPVSEAEPRELAPQRKLM